MGNGGAFAAMAFVLGLMLVFIALAGRLTATVAAVTAPQLLVPTTPVKPVPNTPPPVQNPSRPRVSRRTPIVQG